MNFQKNITFINQNELVLNNNHYAVQLRNVSLIPTSDFLLSTIYFWNNLSMVHYFNFESSFLLVLLNPPSGMAFGHLLTPNLTEELIENCKNEMKYLGVQKLKITCPNISENTNFPFIKLISERDDFEYVYNLNDIALLQGSQYKKQRNSVSKAIKENGNLRTEKSDLSTIEDIDELKGFCEDCMQIKSEKSSLYNSNLQKEWLAFQKCLDMNKSFNLKILKLYANNILSGFIIYEELNNEWIVGHFFKTKNGLGVYLLKELAANLSAQNFKYFNFQEDRGVESLRYFKQQLNPAFYLKSYSIAYN
ncbi:MAG: phosphatidylglycerol lysyltransferase domain-containing protein [Bacteroidia bacterium]